MGFFDGIFLLVVCQAAQEPRSRAEPLKGTVPDESPQQQCRLDCKHGGTCELVKINDKLEEHCKCKRGWTGETCSTCLGRIDTIAELETFGTIHDGIGNYSSSSSAKCSWLIRAQDHPEPDSKYLIELNLTSFETECGWDHLYIFDGTSAHDSSLIAALCGIMKEPPTLYTTSGFAFLHFYSDMAYNMSGFEIKYRAVEKKAADAIAIRVQDKIKLGNWDRFDKFDSGMDPRASPSIVLIDKTVYIWGGYQFEDKTDELDTKMWKYNLEGDRNFQSIPTGSNFPSLRYGSPMTVFGEKIFIYGGVTYPDYSLLEDVWMFDPKSEEWSQAEKYTSEEAEITPLKISGHSLKTIKFQNGTEKVVSFGGYTTNYGYLSIVQEFEFESSCQTGDQCKYKAYIPVTLGKRVPGSYGHVALVDQVRGWIVYIYAGFQNNILFDSLIQYDAENRVFYELPSSKSAGGSNRWFHSGGLVGDRLFFFSGNSHNDTTQSAGSLCYSNEVLSYSLKCQTWEKESIDSSFYSRYGAVSVSYSGSIIIFGGFNGQLLADIVTFTPSEEPECSISRNDFSCPDLEPIRGTALSNAACSYCTYSSQLALNPAEKCKFCSSSVTSRDDGCVSQSESVKSNICSATCEDDFQEFTCQKSHRKCASCVIGGCHYSMTHDQTKKEKEFSCVAPSIPGPRNEDTSDSTNVEIFRDSASCAAAKDPELFECGSFLDCTNCTKHQNCMWCGSLSVCVSNEAYVTSFPFGQCYEWFQRQNCQRTSCSGHLTCKSCQSDPRCGWCDDGTGTGSGLCQDGTLEGDLEQKCIGKRKWYWLTCPLCNCSGHAKCDVETNECLACQSHTYGRNCERCLDGYYGTALNKGSCEKCSCGEHGTACDHRSGKCSCTTKGIIGDHCDECDSEYNNTNGLLAGSAKNGTCYYKVVADFQYSFRMKPEQDKYVSKLNCQIKPEKEQPDIEIAVKTEEETLRVNITTLVDDGEEELITSSNATDDFKAVISYKDYNFGLESNRSLRIYIYDFKTPLVIKVSVTQQDSMNLLTFFLVFFACFLSLLLIAVIVWKLKTMYDVYLQRRAVINEMREMAARPFAQVQLNTDAPLLDNEQPQPVCYEVLEDHTAAVATVFLVLPRHKDGNPPIGHSSLCFGSVMISFDEKTEQDLLLPILPVATSSGRGEGLDNPTWVDVSRTSPAGTS